MQLRECLLEGVKKSNYGQVYARIVAGRRQSLKASTKVADLAFRIKGLLYSLCTLPAVIGYMLHFVCTFETVVEAA